MFQSLTFHSPSTSSCNLLSYYFLSSNLCSLSASLSALALSALSLGALSSLNYLYCLLSNNLCLSSGLVSVTATYECESCSYYHQREKLLHSRKNLKLFNLAKICIRFQKCK